MSRTADEIQIRYDKHHKVSSLVKSHQNKHNSAKYEVLNKTFNPGYKRVKTTMLKLHKITQWNGWSKSKVLSAKTTEAFSQMTANFKATLLGAACRMHLTTLLQRVGTCWIFQASFVDVVLINWLGPCNIVHQDRVTKWARNMLCPTKLLHWNVVVVWLGLANTKPTM